MAQTQTNGMPDTIRLIEFAMGVDNSVERKKLLEPVVQRLKATLSNSAQQNDAMQLDDAAARLQTENTSLRAELARLQAVNGNLQAELTRLQLVASSALHGQASAPIDKSLIRLGVIPDQAIVRRVWNECRPCSNYMRFPWTVPYHPNNLSKADIETDVFSAQETFLARQLGPVVLRLVEIADDGSLHVVVAPGFNWSIDTPLVRVLMNEVYNCLISFAAQKQKNPKIKLYDVVGVMLYRAKGISGHVGVELTTSELQRTGKLNMLAIAPGILKRYKKLAYDNFMLWYEDALDPVDEGRKNLFVALHNIRNQFLSEEMIPTPLLQKFIAETRSPVIPEHLLMRVALEAIAEIDDTGNATRAAKDLALEYDRGFTKLHPDWPFAEWHKT